MEEPKVEIAIEEEQLVVDGEQAPTKEQEASLSTNPQDIPMEVTKVKCLTDGCDMSFASADEFAEHAKIHVKNKGGRPCDFCRDPQTILKKVKLYLEYCEGKVDGKMHIPFLQELCGYGYLEMLTTTMWDWVKSEDHKAEHAELSNAIKTLMERQQLRLLQRTLGAHNPVGAIFQLKANHGMIETEKKLLVGDKGAPLETVIRIVEEKPNPKSEE